MKFNIEARDKFIRTPLHLCSIMGHPTVARTLLKANANIEAKDSVFRNKNILFDRLEELLFIMEAQVQV